MKIEWIDIEYDLPEDGEHVLVINELGKPYIARYIEDMNKPAAWKDEFNESCRVTHWMPLPEPPTDKIS